MSHKPTSPRPDLGRHANQSELPAPEPSTPSTLERVTMNQIFRQAARCGVLAEGDDPETLYQTIRWLFEDLSPKGTMEMMLVSQIIGTYLVIMHQLYLSTKECTPESVNVRINMVAKLQRVMTQQLNLLASLRGICSQKVRIERIDISGGQSIIGSQVDQGGRG